ncbi:MAG: fatty acid desaturase [Dongiaceae bacterium]
MSRFGPGETSEFAVNEARLIAADLFRHKPILYWIDFAISYSIAVGATIVYFAEPNFSWLQIAMWFVAGFAIFRTGVFIHEIVHMPARHMTGFKVAWNVLFGLPMLTPSFMYSNHRDHHNRRHYGTAKDGEYLPMGIEGRDIILRYLLQILLLPAFAMFRFFVLTPLTIVAPPLRRWVLERASSYVCNPDYRRELPPNEDRSWWLPAEIGCFLLMIVLIVGIATTALHWWIIAEIYLLGMLGVGLNWFRNLLAHRYCNHGGELTHAQQLLDTITIGGRSPLIPLLFPVGMRYHALHHLFPAIPYHNLGEGHRRLMAQLPAGSSYRKTVSPGLWAVLSELWRRPKSEQELAYLRPRIDSRAA